MDRHPTCRTRAGGVSTEQRERIDQARRADRVARVQDAGMAPETAERAVAAWQAEAASGGLSRGDPRYRDEGDAWIIERYRE